MVMATHVSRKVVTLSYTSAALSPSRNRKKNLEKRFRASLKLLI